MTKEIKTLTEDMLKVYICPELKDTAEKFLAADGKENEVEAKGVLLKTLPECIATIDEALEFALSDYCKEKFGEEAAKQLYAATKEQKDNGAKYCGCPGCQAALKLLEALK